MFGMTGIAAKLGEYLIVILVVAGVMFGVYYKGGVDMKDEIALEQAKADSELTKKYEKVSSDYEDLKNKRQQKFNTITHEVTRIIEKPVYNVQCVDQEGVDVINKALSGK